jgi:3-oxoacyl-[acyl-carrier-protein] synthase III
MFDDLPDRLREMELQQSGAQKLSTVERSDRAAKPGSPRIRIESVGTIPDEVNGKKNSMELLSRAAKNSLGKSSYQCSDIGLLIYTGVYRSEYVLEPAYAALLAGELDMNATTSIPDNKKTLAFDIFNGSMGFLNGCYVAQELIAAGNCENAMIVAAEIENNFDWSPDALVGVCETASAVILASDPAKDCGFSRFLFKCHEKLIDAYATYTDTSDRQPYLHVMKDSALERLYVDCILSAVQEILEMEKIDLSRINIIFPPQVSSSFIKRLSERLDLPLERFIDAVGKGPDLFSSSVPYAFEYAYKKQLVRTGDTGLIIAVGSGIQVGCAVYHF